jgi:Na+/melibiose symporter-like transporter
MRLPRWSVAPPEATPVQRRNYRNVQIDAVGVGIAGAAAQFLPIFLTRLGASNVEVGLLTSMPALTGLFLSLFVGRFLETRRKIVPWFSAARLMVISAYALTGLITLLAPPRFQVQAVLLIWAAVTLPQIVVNVAFSVVMNAVAGPNGRYNLMSRRWSILGTTTAVFAALIGQALDRIAFPLNYQLAFIGLSVGGLISYYFSSHIELPESAPPQREGQATLRERVAGYFSLVRGQRAFVRFALLRFVFLGGTALAAPLFPLYFVREVNASNAWIGIINTAQTMVLVVSYMLWVKGSQRWGTRFPLLGATLGLSLYPALVALTQRVELIAVYAGLAGICQAGLDLAFFDELMKTVPPEHSATFVSLAQSLQYVSAVIAPLIGTALAGVIGLSGALLVSAAVRFIGFGLFAVWWTKSG